MARGSQREDSHDKIAEERKYLWVQYFGMGIFLATWPGIMMVAMFGVPIRPEVFAVLMLTVAAVVFAIGHYGRQELRERK